MTLAKLMFVVMPVAIVGCSATTKLIPPPTSNSQSTAVSSDDSEPVDPFPDASNAKGLDQTLATLKSTKEAGNLTDDEYARARAVAIDSYVNDIKFHEQQRQSITAKNLHDELGYLTQMKKELHLNDEEYEHTKSAVVNYYLTLGQ